MDDRIGYLLKRTQSVLRAAMDKELSHKGLTTPQYAVLSTLQATPGCSGAELARRSFVTAQTMQRLLETLESAQLLTRAPHPESGRTQVVTLTTRGRRLVTACHARVEAIEERMLAGLSDGEQRRLAGLLHHCLAALGDGAPPPKTTPRSEKAS